MHCIYICYLKLRHSGDLCFEAYAVRGAGGLCDKNHPASVATSCTCTQSAHYQSKWTEEQTNK